MACGGEGWPADCRRGWDLFSFGCSASLSPVCSALGSVEIDAWLVVIFHINHNIHFNFQVITFNQMFLRYFSVDPFRRSHDNLHGASNLI